MRKTFYLLLVCSTSVLYSQTQALKVGTNPYNVNSKAVLELESTTKGFLPPRMTLSQINAITSPPEGLMIYCTDCPDGQKMYQYSGTAWGSMGAASSSTSVAINCDANGFVGAYVNGSVLSGTSFTITITNNTYSAISPTFAVADLTLSGVSGITVSSVSPVSPTIASGASQLVTYTLTGTPGSAGTLTGLWKKLGLTCTKTKVITKGDAIFTGLPLTNSVISVLGYQGIIDNSTKKSVFTIPYTGGVGTYDAYTSSPITVNDQSGTPVSLKLSYPSGSFSSTGSITATVIVGAGSTEVFNVPQQAGNSTSIATFDFMLNGVSKGSLKIDALGGILDRNFADVNHKFIYSSITVGSTVWLNNNLGADYANVNSPSFSPLTQPNSSTDFKGFGSIFQWGRSADGHELMSYTSSGSIGTPVNGSTTIKADIPSNSLFITGTTWRITNDTNLWNGESAVNNPCPSGYRVPSPTEFTTMLTSLGISNSASAYASVLKFTYTGYRLSSSGNYSSGIIAYHTSQLGMYNNMTTNVINDITNGFPVRCIKN